MIRAYLSGPLTGDGSAEAMVRNVNAALDAMARLEAAGFLVHCPHLRYYLHLRHPMPYRHHMDVDLSWLPTCDILVRLDGDSPGADDECSAARELGLAVYTLDEAITELGRATQ